MCFRNRLDIVGGRNMFAGDTKTQVSARDALQILVERAQARRTITFTELTRELEVLGHNNHILNMGYVCRHIVKTLAQLERQDDWEGEIPHITSIVLRENGECGGNMAELFTGDRRRQPSAQQLQTELDCSFDYERWDAVLIALSLSR